MQTSRRGVIGLLLAVAAVIMAAGVASGATNAKQPIHVAVLSSTAGATAAAGIAEEHSITLALRQINARGGLLGRPVVADFRGDGGDAAQAVAQAKALLRGHPAAFFGSSTSNTTAAVHSVVAPAKVIFFPGSATQALVDPQKYPYTFRAYLTEVSQRQALLDYLKKAGIKKLAVFASSDAFGQANANNVVPYVTTVGTDLVINEGLTPGTDFTPLAIEAKAKGADAVFVIVNSLSDLANFAKALKNVGFQGQYLTTPAGLQKAYTALAGDAGRQTISFTFKALSYPKNGNPSKSIKRWLTQLHTVGDISGDLRIANVLWYDAVTIWAAGVRRANSINPDKVKNALESMKNFPAIAGNVSFSKTDHDGLASNNLAAVYAATYSDGVYQIVP